MKTISSLMVLFSCVVSAGQQGQIGDSQLILRPNGQLSLRTPKQLIENPARYVELFGIAIKPTDSITFKSLIEISGRLFLIRDDQKLFLVGAEPVRTFRRGQIGRTIFWTAAGLDAALTWRYAPATPGLYVPSFMAGALLDP